MLKKTALAFAFLTVSTAFRCSDSGALRSTTDSERTGSAYSLLLEGEYVISAYDELIRDISEQEGHDWRLLSAIAYHESRFRAHLVSPRGARGLMQIMPSVARQFGVPVGTAADPETNVWLANKLLSRIMEALRIAEGTSAEDRMSIVLASYNGGLGHVCDARRLARFYGENPDSWEVVKRYLKLKSQPEYYTHEVVECGRFSGSRQTAAYVDDVLGHYKKYCLMTSR